MTKSQIILFSCSIIVAIILLVILFHESYTRKHGISANFKKRGCRHLYLSDYLNIIETPEKYAFIAPFGISSALATFNSEVPDIIECVQTCIERNRHLISRYETNNEDPEVLNAFLKIELQLTSMIANHGISLTKRCRFYCENTSKSFNLVLDNQIVVDFCNNAHKLRSQLAILEGETFKTNEVPQISHTMYSEFYTFFNSVNDLIYISTNENDKDKNSIDEEEPTNDEHRLEERLK